MGGSGGCHGYARLVVANEEAATVVRAARGDWRSERMSGVLEGKQGGRECATDGRREA